jgi:plastocyanin
MDRRRETSSHFVTRILLVAAVLLVAGCGAADYSTKPAAATSAETAAKIVEMTDSTFTPNTVDMKVGETVTFVDKDEIAHTATAEGSFDSGTLREGARFAFKATQAGTYDYVCVFHPGMTGRISVT